MSDRPRRGRHDTILYLSRRDVVGILDTLEVAGIVHRAIVAHADGRAVVPPEAYLEWEVPGGGTARSLAMPGSVDGSVGTKIINANTANRGIGLPRADGLTLLFDPATAQIRAVVAASPISAARTAAVTAIAAHALGPRTISTLALLGAGEVGRAHAGLLTRVLTDLRDVRVFDVDRRRAETLTARIRDQMTPSATDVRTSATPEDAIRGSHLVVPATTANAGYIPPDWLSPGALVVHVSLDDLLPEALLGADRLFVDDWDLVRADGRRVLGRLIRAGLVAGPGEDASAARAIDGTLGDVLTGRKPGRRTDEEVIVFNPFGMAITDVAVADAVVAAGCRRAVGLALPR